MGALVVGGLGTVVVSASFAPVILPKLPKVKGGNLDLFGQLLLAAGVVSSICVVSL